REGRGASARCADDDGRGAWSCVGSSDVTIYFSNYVLGRVLAIRNVERNGLRKTQELEDLVDVLASAVGSLANAAKIKATFKSALHSSISTAAVRSYIDFLLDPASLDR
ncbi:MAG: hypothetical protein KIG15_06290, partial [Coriobacteriales bacterium]|nr:hypothetical protein [Coriobacteriales bacterium]